MSGERETLRREAVVAIARFVIGLAVLLFLPALGFYWIGFFAWLHVTFWTVVVTAYLYWKKPELLARRMNAGASAESEPAQKRIQAFNAVFVILQVIICGLDRLFHLSNVPLFAVVAGHMLIAAGFVIVLVTFRENSFAASTVGTFFDQRVITTGPYAVVRHPMYSGGILIFFGWPMALASWWGLACSVALLAGIVARLLHEETILVDALADYAPYSAKVPARLLPGIW